ncbi:MAG: sulfite exporter TauE/SafE family protein [Litorilituus sp.]|nr:sulfite exporter TauE/SafE family protein [Litorilituus sp.]
MFELLLLFLAGFVGGTLNSIAGGGSFITFPALLYVGIPPVAANATNTFASCAGYVSGAYAFRESMYEHKKKLPLLITISLIGGLLGAWFLLQTPESIFQEAIPWLLLFATLLFIFGLKINMLLKKLTSNYQHATLLGYLLLVLILLSISIYGGFFNAGLGIITLSYLALAGYTNINTMNGMKLLISSLVSLIAIAVFITSDVIAWYEGIIVLMGSSVGGYLAANISKRISQCYIRNFVIIVSCAITLYFFIKVYSS